MRSLRWMLVGGARLAAVGSAAGAGLKIVQKDFGFSEKEVRVRVGDRVTFENQDPVTRASARPCASPWWASTTS